jgi:hypothetical protein
VGGGVPERAETGMSGKLPGVAADKRDESSMDPTLTGSRNRGQISRLGT